MQRFHVIIASTENGQIIWLHTDAEEVESYYADWIEGYGGYESHTKIIGTVEALNKDQAMIFVAQRSTEFHYTTYKD